jgi:hypothetical protein
MGLVLRLLKPIALVLLVALGSPAAAPIPSVRACNSCNFQLEWGSQGSGNGQFNHRGNIAVDVAENVGGRDDRSTQTRGG